MPRGRVSKKSKLQNALTTRLIQISLKTDDHIYYGKNISTSAATEYLQEITSLKQKCPRTNLHALQVIEKLTGIMETIITEAQDLLANHSKNLNIQVDSGFLRTSSPVYSLPDEDRIENFTDDPVIDICEDITDNDTSAIRQEKNIENVFNAISNMTIMDQDDFTDIPIIDITENSDVTTPTQQEKTIENNTISNIANQDATLQTQAMFEDDDCSQSILDNFHDNSTRSNEILQIKNNAVENASDLNYFVAQTPNLNEISIGVHARGVVEHPQCLGIEPRINAKAPQRVSVCEIKETGLDRNVTLSNSLTGIQTTNKNNSCNLKTCEVQPTQPIIKPRNILEKHDKNITTVRKESTSFNCITNKVQDTEPYPKEKKKIVRRKQNKDNGEEKKKKKPKRKVHNDNEAAVASVKPQLKRKGSQTKSIVTKAHEKIPNVTKPVTEIYNSNVENDLSWVENLRFVREISPAENDPALTILDENFWNNFSLPNNWNDLDFD